MKIIEKPTARPGLENSQKEKYFLKNWQDCMGKLIHRESYKKFKFNHTAKWNNLIPEAVLNKIQFFDILR